VPGAFGAGPGLGGFAGLPLEEGTGVTAGRRAAAGSAVLHFMAHWLPVSEGFVYDLVRHTRRDGIVVATTPLENTERFPCPDVHSLAGLERVLPGRLARRPLTAALLVLAARRGVGLVHVHHGYDAYKVLGLVHRRRLPLVLSLHGDDLTGYRERYPGVYDHVAPATQAAVVPSAFLAERAVAAGFGAEQVRVIPSGIDTSFFTPTPLPDGPPEALFVGRFVPKKGLDVLAAAWPAVQRAVPAARLRIMGFGPLEEMVRRIDGQVDVVLSPTRQVVRDAMRRAWVVVSPSHTAPGDAVESLVVVNLEAQASGRAVVTTRHGGIPEHVLEDRTALVVPEGDHRALADALGAVLGDGSLAARLGAAGPSWAQDYDIRRVARRVDALYDELWAGAR
jgi:colanic acid/amylovoran biosynthesis glycosyltransferase